MEVLVLRSQYLQAVVVQRIRRLSPKEYIRVRFPAMARMKGDIMRPQVGQIGLKRLGQIGLKTEAKGFVERAVEFVTRSSVHHVVIAISDNEVISAEPGGARIRPHDYSYFVWSQFEMTDEQAQACADWARAREGAPYSFINGFFIGLSMYGIRIPLAIRKRIARDTHYQCAQLADAALTLGAGITVFEDGRDFGEVYPGALEQLFKERGWWVEGVS